MQSQCYNVHRAPVFVIGGVHDKLVIGGDEKLLLKKLAGIEKPQLSNLKTHLYRQVLASLRLQKRTENLDLELNEQLDYARSSAGDYAASLQALAALKAPVDAFFDGVMVNAEQLDLRLNRLGLLRSLHESMNRVAQLERLAT